MNLEATTRRVFLPLLLAAGVALAATSAGADNESKPNKTSTRGQSVLWDEIQDGKAKKLSRPGPDKHTTAVWDGCKFHYLKTKVELYQGTNGAMGEVSTDPEPLPPKDRTCVKYRDPTLEEMAESQARVAAANAGEQGLDPSLPPAPPPPPVGK